MVVGRQVLSLKIPGVVVLYCDYCDKEFTRPRWHLLKADKDAGGKNYCSRNCFAQCRSKRYDTHYYCTNCLWIPIKDVVSKLLNGIEYQHCPKCKGKIRKNSHKTRLNHKRKNIKRF
jgi:hypothetical protein